MRIIVFLVSVLMISSVSAFAQMPDPITIGAGNYSCGKFLAFEKESPNYVSTVSWVMGYISSWNAQPVPSSKDTFAADPWNISRGEDGEALLAWIKNYCQEHPLDKISRASGMLGFELVKRSAKTEK